MKPPPPVNVPEMLPVTELIPLIVPTVSPNINPAQLQRVPLKSPGGTAIQVR